MALNIQMKIFLGALFWIATAPLLSAQESEVLEDGNKAPLDITGPDAESVVRYLDAIFPAKSEDEMKKIQTYKFKDVSFPAELDGELFNIIILNLFANSAEINESNDKNFETLSPIESGSSIKYKNIHNPFFKDSSIWEMAQKINTDCFSNFVILYINPNIIKEYISDIKKYTEYFGQKDLSKTTVRIKKSQNDGWLIYKNPDDEKIKKLLEAEYKARWVFFSDNNRVKKEEKEIEELAKGQLLLSEYYLKNKDLEAAANYLLYALDLINKTKTYQKDKIRDNILKKLGGIYQKKGKNIEAELFFKDDPQLTSLRYYEIKNFKVPAAIKEATDSQSSAVSQQNP